MQLVCKYIKVRVTDSAQRLAFSFKIKDLEKKNPL
jgi:hypothetical protein